MSDNRKVLLVDDEPNVLQGYKRHLRKMFDLECGLSGDEGLQLIREAHPQPFAVVVSDMSMPGMNGVEFLEQVKSLCPDTARIMLTGNADQKTATDAVNRGSIFKFLNKPCEPKDLAEAIENGVLRHKADVQESAMLSKTVAGAVSMMTDVLSLVNPDAFGRLSNLRRIARQISQQLSMQRTWEVEMGAMLSQIGCITVPAEILKKVRSGQPLSDEETNVFQDHPRIGAGLIRKIPRLDTVAEAVEHQLDRRDQTNQAKDSQPSLAALVLKATLDFDLLCNSGSTEQQAVARMQQDAAAYDDGVLDALLAMTAVQEQIVNVELSELKEGMILDAHVCSREGGVLVAAGHVINPSLCARLKKFALRVEGVREPIRVRLPASDSAVADQNLASTAPEVVSQ